MLTSATVLIASLVAAVLSGIVSLCKLVDRKRQTKRPFIYDRPEMAVRVGERTTASQEVPSASRRAPLMAGRRYERCAKLSSVAPLMESGDPGLFSGRSVFGLAVRCLEYTSMSHAWILERDSEGGLWIVDSCEGVGVTRRSLTDEVKKYPGQLYWSRVAWQYRQHYKRDQAIAAAHAMLGNKYGWLAIAFQVAIHTPILRTIAYATSLDRKLARSLAFCSGALAMLMLAGGLDPVPGRDPALITPQDIAQSLVAEEWIALLPG